MLTIGQKVLKLSGLVGRRDMKPKDEQFIEDMLELTLQGKRTSHLTSGQVEYIDSLHKQNFQD